MRDRVHAFVLAIRLTTQPNIQGAGVFLSSCFTLYRGASRDRARTLGKGMGMSHDAGLTSVRVGLCKLCRTGLTAKLTKYKEAQESSGIASTLCFAAPSC